MLNFARALALDYGPKGVRVNAIAPSLVRTDAIAGLLQNADAVAAFEHRVPLGRIADVVLPIDGGTTASNGQARL